jgi:hypothetical protein
VPFHHAQRADLFIQLLRLAWRVPILMSLDPPPKRSPDNLRFMSSTPIVAVPLPETDIPLRLQIYLVNNYRTIIHIKYFKKTLSLLFSMFNEIFSLTFNK